MLLAVVAGAVLLSAGGMTAAAFIKSPADQARSAGPPPADVLTAPVEHRVIKDSVVLRGQVSADQTVEISPVAAGTQDTARVVVTKLPYRAGDTLAGGKVVVEMSGRPVFALTGRLPVYRDLKPGADGEDVAQAQRALGRLGYPAGGDRKGHFGAGTKRAVDRYYASIGYEPLPADPEGGAEVAAAQDAVTEAHRAWQDAAGGRRKTRAAEDLGKARRALAAAEAANGPMLPASEVVFLRGFPARVEKVNATVGTEAKEKLLTVSAGSLVVDGDLDAARKDLVRVGQRVEILAEATGDSARGAVASVSEAPVQGGEESTDGDAGGADTGGEYVVKVSPDKPLPGELAGQDVRLTVAAGASKGKVLAVPLSAVSAGADGRTAVTVYDSGSEDRRRVEVTTGTSGNGFVAIRPRTDGSVRAGDQVVVGKRQGGDG
ncbi:peptidoglycan-binding protein [Streptomyces lasiicapitis]|uniref:peptidoglycan-binding protein n=1 Tax=Streptomyces lasiicapitis TaxID=1923961 RepID=UPI001E4B6937|nr:peptidoglycan-binding protein [Streptomyces lasiicapitis]